MEQTDSPPLQEGIPSAPAPEGGRGRRKRGRRARPFTRYNGYICTNIWKSEKSEEDSRKRRKAYHRLRTGLRVHHGQKMRFLTLTLVKGSEKDIHECFRVLKERIRRLTPNKIKNQDTSGFFTPRRMYHYFGKSVNGGNPIKFEYFSVKVLGDRQHMHVLYFGDWLPHAWLKKVWKEITSDSDVVDIRTTKEGVKNEKSLASYVLTQYELFQTGDIRFQMSHGWTWRGMARDWKQAVKKFTKQVKGKSILKKKELFAYWVDVVQSKKTVQKCLLTDNKN